MLHFARPLIIEVICHYLICCKKIPKDLNPPSIVTHSSFTRFNLRYQYLLFPFKFIFLSIGFTVVIPLVSCFRAKNQATSIESGWRIYQSSRWNVPAAGLFWQPCLRQLKLKVTFWHQVCCQDQHWTSFVLNLWASQQEQSWPSVS